MRDVRRRERLEGRKRGSKRDAQLKRTKPIVVPKVQSLGDSPNERALACWTPSSSSPSSFSSSSSSSSEESGDLIILDRSRLLPKIWLSNPVNTLSGSHGCPPMVAGLIFYCKCFTSYISNSSWLPLSSNGLPKWHCRILLFSGFICLTNYDADSQDNKREICLYSHNIPQ